MSGICSAHKHYEKGCRLCEAFEERAAIMEFDGGMSREEAERQAGEIIPYRDGGAEERIDAGIPD